jgi:hypothetical protein
MTDDLEPMTVPMIDAALDTATALRRANAEAEVEHTRLAGIAGREYEHWEAVTDDLLELRQSITDPDETEGSVADAWAGWHGDPERDDDRALVASVAATVPAGEAFPALIEGFDGVWRSVDDDRAFRREGVAWLLTIEGPEHEANLRAYMETIR